MTKRKSSGAWLTRACFNCSRLPFCCNEQDIVKSFGAMVRRGKQKVLTELPWYHYGDKAYANDIKFKSRSRNNNLPCISYCASGYDLRVLLSDSIKGSSPWLSHLVVVLYNFIVIYCDIRMFSVSRGVTLASLFFFDELVKIKWNVLVFNVAQLTTGHMVHGKNSESRICSNKMYKGKKISCNQSLSVTTKWSLGD